ncbi:NAD(P)H-dependent oxidoreductase [Xinfangfangia sp. D13-10-4-6]|uniref:NADPH-dependent FMN reductase n=1 Tax=Pseudogemmobacter hezensis TaxID=2737662 RepID=UPI0015540F12|nr:NAD(P)H-dependent oxidoreductase [Pseudogemmobacter hezensis]NPD14533.1 NAD(P)H-dependent oxidoreductase [Pseudogemmobacter hezensis]
MSSPTKTDLILLGISGALRKGSTNRMLLREARAAFGPATHTEADLNLPLYDGDLELAEGIPPGVQTLYDQIAAADAVVISTPEYNKAPPGVLKNALDWVSRIKVNPWADKPVAIISAAGGRGGGDRSQFALRLMMTPFQPHLLSGPEVLVADSSNAFDEDGHLKDPRYQKVLDQLMAKLRQAAGRG